MTDENLVDIVLTKCVEQSPTPMNVGQAVVEDDFILKIKKVSDVISVLTFEELVYETGNSYIKPTQKGINVFKNGGYLKYLNEKTKIENNEKAFKEIEEQKQKIDLKQSKRTLKWFWPLTIYSILTSGLTVYSTMISESNKEELYQIQSELASISKTLQLTNKEFQKVRYEFSKTQTKHLKND